MQRYVQIPKIAVDWERGGGGGDTSTFLKYMLLVISEFI